MPVARDRAHVGNALLWHGELEFDGLAGTGDDRLAAFERDVVLDGSVVDEAPRVGARLCRDRGRREGELRGPEVDRVARLVGHGLGRGGSSATGQARGTRCVGRIVGAGDGDGREQRGGREDSTDASARRASSGEEHHGLHP
jgi:hypothetical protein